MVKGFVLVCIALPVPLSVTVTMMANEPVTVGVPESVPSLAKFRPAGSAPLPLARLQVYGEVPPAAENLKEG
jgi:hypothetical protein